ncbi:MAG: sugar kinase [Phenylobacterium sp.]|uniref:sugar kinase n=1 Tax=Phenylobacterium sp. TaxID=1871053 RepID=UPI0027363F9C|nr:sugar kinase [Phenylobacterium sp.]MDP3175153.1 sugar kinase [Phenylobacterium sp.]
MVDLNAEMAELWASLGASAPGRARTVQLVSARRGEGASTVARELARYVAASGRTVWLIDLDLLASPQHAILGADPSRYGVMGEPTAATPDGSVFFTVQPGGRTSDGRPWPDGAYLNAHRVGRANLWVTRFRRDLLRAGQTVHVVQSPRYWESLRRHVEVVIVDAPSADRSQAAITLAPFMDQTVLVVAADEADVRAPALLRDAIGGAGGTVAGLFFNRMTLGPPSFLKGLLP